MTGFFDIPKQSNTKGMTCAACGLYAKVRSPRMEPFGKFKKRILCLGEAPGEVEDLRDQPWQGKVGQALQRAFTKLGYDLFDDCISINSIMCRPTSKDGNNRPPTSHEIACCHSRVLSTIKEMQPHVIILFGNAAVESVIGHRWQNDLKTISRWRGWTIPDRDFNAWICPVFHPSFVERGEKEIETIWMQDLENALSMVDKPLPKWQDESKQVEIVTDLSFLSDMKGPVAFDIETTGLKPHDKSKHRIICMSVCNREDKAYAFMIPEDKNQRRNIRLFLKSDILKIAQNCKFEAAWSQNIFNCEVQNWVFDTMLASHVLDNRPDITGLKFQVYIRFGRLPYDEDVCAFIKSKDQKNANSTNQILDLIKTESGKEKLLVYCGLDSLFERRLALKQMKELGVNGDFK